MEKLDRRRFRILIVEDEYWIASMLETTLRDAGYDVVGPASTLREGVMLAMTEQIDAALLDIRLPKDATSYSVADALDERNIPFGFITAHRDIDIELLYRDRPRWFKPFISDEILEGLDILVNDRQSTERK
jgi:DNA-binding response OmpR family regulator